MTLHLTIHPTGRRVQIDVPPSFTLADILATISEIIADPRVEPGFELLTDHTRVEEFLTPDQARVMAAYLEGRADRFAGTRWAVVTTHAVSFGMLRMLGAMLESIPIEVAIFETHAEADAWLTRGSAGLSA